MLIQLIDLIPKTDLVLNHLYLFYEITDQSKAEQKALKIYEQIKNSNYKLALKLLDFMELPIKDYELTRVISSLSYKDEEKIFSLLPQISNKEQQALALCSLYPFNDRGQYIKDEFLPELYSDEENIDTAGINYVDINAFLSFVDRLPEKFDYAKDNLYKKVAISLIENEFFLGIDIANRIKNATIRESVFDSFFGEDDFHCHYWLDVVTTMEDAFKLIEKLNEVSLKKHFFLDLLGSLYCVESIDSERQSGKIMVPIERLGEVVALFENIVGKYIPAINLIERISDTSLKKALMKGYALEYAAAGKMPFRLCHAMSEADVNLIITTFMNSLPGKKTPGNYINQSLNLIASENPALGKRSLFSLNSGTFNAKTAEMLLLNKPIGSWFVRYSDRTRTYIFCFKIDDYKVAQKTIKAPISLELMEAELNQVFPESLRVEVKFVT